MKMWMNLLRTNIPNAVVVVLHRDLNNGFTWVPADYLWKHGALHKQAYLILR